MFDELALGEALSILRGERSQRQIARRARVSPATWCEWEAGKRLPRRSQLPKILRGLDCSEQVFMATVIEVLARRLKDQGFNFKPPAEHPDESLLEPGKKRFVVLSFETFVQIDEELVSDHDLQMRRVAR